jgi:hypothetical protein
LINNNNHNNNNDYMIFFFHISRGNHIIYLEKKK